MNRPGGLRQRAARRHAGFTLVEVLVALLLMAILAGFAWQGLDAVLRAREASRESIDRTTRLATVLTQWQQDLQAVVDTGVVPALTFDGQTLRLTRRDDDGVVLVAWAVRGGNWQRWAGAPATRSAALQQTWMASQQFLGNEPGHLTVAEGATEWQIYFHRDNAWTNAQSTGNLVTGLPGSSGPPGQQGQPGQAGQPGAGGAPIPVLRVQLPNAVRLVVTLPAGRLTRDVALGPTGS